MKASVDEVASAFRARRPPATNAVPGEVWKGGTGFVVREEAGERTMAAMHWGFPRHSINKRTGSPNKPSPVNNARDDTLMSPFGTWREWFMAPTQIGRASCRDRVCPLVSFSVVAVSFKKK